MLKILKVISMLAVLLLILSSCDQEKKEMVNENKVTIIQNESTKIIGNSENEDNDEIRVIEKSDEEVLQSMQDSASKNIIEAKSTDENVFNQKLKGCDDGESPETCKRILIEIEAEQQKNINFCKKHSHENDIRKCKSKVASKLAGREMNPKYCNELDGSHKEDCIKRYEENLKRELEMMKTIEKLQP